MGGVRALRLWSQITGAPTPDVYHANEGHAGFLGVERISELVRAEGMSFDEALEAVRARHRLHDPHPGARRHRPVRRLAHRALLRRRAGPRGRARRAAAAPRRRDLRGRLGRHVQHGRHGPAPRPARQRRLAAARRRQPRDVRRPVAGLRRRRGADHLDHQRRARPDLGRPQGLRAGPHPRRRARARHPGVVGGVRDRAAGCRVGHQARAAPAARRGGPPPHPPVLARARRVAGRARLDRRDPRPRRAHHRLRPPGAHLQAAHPDAARPRAAQEAAAAPDAADPARHRRQVAPGRRDRQAADPAAGEVRRRPRGAPPHRLPAQLRHRHGAAPLPGLRRLAEQPAAPVRGLRHVRHEGRAQRRAQPVHPRRLVGRVVRRQERLGDPDRRRRRGPRPP